MKAALRCLISALLPLLLLSSCHDDGSDRPHPATLYDICEVASPDGSQQTVLNLYRPDSDNPVILTAPAGALGDQAPEEGTSILAAYTPLNGHPYTDSPITIHSWATITNIPLQEAKTSEDIQGWDTDPVWLLAAWRAGNKICMRLRLGYDTTPRRFALVLDPSTADDPIPTAYLYHLRPSSAPTFDRQYYVAFDIARLWSRPSLHALRICLSNSADPSLSTLLFKKTATQE